jgi:sirohydrochlorin cobaltochelatase
MTSKDRTALETLEKRLKVLLPEEYQDSYEDLQAVPMRSAGLKYRADGRVAWDQIWGSFCDLAMAGGPPHKGTLLEPGRAADIDAQPGRYEEVSEEICRGVRMAADLDAEPSPHRGWVRVLCLNDIMSGWLLRAIVMENVSVRAEGSKLDLPSAPGFRLEKEIKNVVTVIAKTCHYWLGHMPRSQHRAIASAFAEMAAESPLIEPAFPAGDDPDSAVNARQSVADTIQRSSALRVSTHRYTGWIGVDCVTVRAAIWMMRAMVASNVLSRREATVLFVPINQAADPEGHRVATALARVHDLAAARNVL